CARMAARSEGSRLGTLSWGRRVHSHHCFGRSWQGIQPRNLTVDVERAPGPNRGRHPVFWPGKSASCRRGSGERTFCDTVEVHGAGPFSQDSIVAKKFDSLAAEFARSEGEHLQRSCQLVGRADLEASLEEPTYAGVREQGRLSRPAHRA